MKNVLLSGLTGYHYKAYQSPTVLSTQEGGSDLPKSSFNYSSH